MPRLDARTKRTTQAQLCGYSWQNPGTAKVLRSARELDLLVHFYYSANCATRKGVWSCLLGATEGELA